MQDLLEETVGPNVPVYFQPASDDKMDFPCVVYELDSELKRHANNSVYKWRARYRVTYVHHNPEDDMIRKLTMLPHSAFQRHFATSGLNHDVFVIYH